MRIPSYLFFCLLFVLATGLLSFLKVSEIISLSWWIALLPLFIIVSVNIGVLLFVWLVLYLARGLK